MTETTERNAVTVSATPQEKIKTTLEKCGIPAKEVRVYGSQVMVTCWGEDAARRFHGVLAKFCSKVRPVIRSLDENVDQTERRTNAPKMHEVWRVWGTI